MEPTTLYIWVAVLADGLAGLTGGLLSEQWLRKHLSVFVGFAAGALLSAVFLELLPEAVTTQGSAAFRWAFGSFMVLAVAERLMGHHHHDHAGTGTQSRTLPAAL